MMRPLGKLVLTLGALAVLASPAWAQARGGRGGFGGMGGGGSSSSGPRTSRKT